MSSFSEHPYIFRERAGTITFSIPKPRKRVTSLFFLEPGHTAEKVLVYGKCVSSSWYIATKGENMFRNKPDKQLRATLAIAGSMSSLWLLGVVALTLVPVNTGFRVSDSPMTVRYQATGATHAYQDATGQYTVYLRGSRRTTRPDPPRREDSQIWGFLTPLESSPRMSWFRPRLCESPGENGCWGKIVQFTEGAIF